MNQNTTTIERAFQIANAGDCGNLTDLKAKLKQEGYDLHEITGPSLSRQLTKLITAAKINRPADGADSEAGTD